MNYFCSNLLFVKQIKARKKILLLGNHDKKKDYKGLFDEIYDGPLLIAEKYFFRMNQCMLYLGA